MNRKRITLGSLAANFNDTPLPVSPKMITTGEFLRISGMGSTSLFRRVHEGGEIRGVVKTGEVRGYRFPEIEAYRVAVLVAAERGRQEMRKAAGPRPTHKAELPAAVNEPLLRMEQLIERQNQIAEEGLIELKAQSAAMAVMADAMAVLAERWQ